MRVSERAFTEAVIEAAQLAGWRCAHFRPCRTERGWRTAVQGDAGFPDLVLADGGVVVFAELKAERGKTTPEQDAWIQDLGGLSGHVHLWRPADWPAIQRVLNCGGIGMRKAQELTDPRSCMSRALDDELTFVLLGRDPAAPAAICAWVEERIRLGKNDRSDSQIREALICAVTMESERESRHAAAQRGPG